MGHRIWAISPIAFVATVSLNCGDVHSPVRDDRAVKQPQSMQVANPQSERALQRIKELGGSYVWEPEMFVVTLRKSRVTDADLAIFADLPLVEVLSLSDTAITDAGLSHLKSIEQLEELFLDGTQVTAAGVARLRSSFPNARIELKPPSADMKNPFVE